MADGDVQPETEKKKSKKKLIMAVVAVLALGGGYYFFLGGGGGEEPFAEEVVIEESVIDGATMTVALVGEETHFARVSFALVLPDGGDTAVVGKKIQLLQDAALTVITGYEAGELGTTAGLDRLRADLTEQAHVIWTPEQVIRIVLTEVLVQ